ncbi:MAG: UDP-N-acetylmuramoyl-tripeptide--D-alanyl-D-alanine ligase [Bacteroidales bacterium]|nr:UDP-N-acetylmuramoyl-tripeptide--D-alanyl-D-alanine ligase [Bacteroidales bacterium]
MPIDIEKLYSAYLDCRDVTTDSRQVHKGSIFFALRGEKFNGNQFIPQALEDGAALCVGDDPHYCTDQRCILVDDSLKALQQLASRHRSSLTIPVIGITGTNGKTTTKELVNAVLSKRYRTWATKGNFNNHIGVPLTILSMPADTEILIVEMGANHPGEIEFLCNIANPDYGLITNVGKAHLEGFGSFKGVVRTKTELYKHLAAMAGVIFVNVDNQILMERAEKMSQLPSNPSVLPGVVPSFVGVTPGDYTSDFVPRGVNMPMASVVTYGSNISAEVKGSFVSSDPYMRFYFEHDDNVYTVNTQLIGGYNFDNAMAAVCVGEFFNVELFDIKTAIEEYKPTNNRSQFKKTSRNTLVLDCYNANPSSMKVSVENFAAMKAEHKMVILGAMRELGSDSSLEHHALLDLVRNSGFERIILVGPEFKFASGKDDVSWFENSDEVLEYLKHMTPPLEGATILVKGSNSNKLWQLEEAL